MILTHQKKQEQSIDLPLSAEEFIALGRMSERPSRTASTTASTTDERDTDTSDHFTIERLKVSSRKFNSRKLADSFFSKFCAENYVPRGISFVRQTTYGKRGDVCVIRQTIFAETEGIATKREKRTRRFTVLHTDRSSRKVRAARDANGGSISRAELVSYVETLRRELEQVQEFRWRCIISRRLHSVATGKRNANGAPVCVAYRRNGQKYWKRIESIGETGQFLGCKRRGGKNDMPCQYDSRLVELEKGNRHASVTLLPIESAEFIPAKVVEPFDDATSATLRDYLEKRIERRSPTGANIAARSVVDMLSRGASRLQAASAHGIPESSFSRWLDDFASRR